MRAVRAMDIVDGMTPVNGWPWYVPVGRERLDAAERERAWKRSMAFQFWVLRTSGASVKDAYYIARRFAWNEQARYCRVEDWDQSNLAKVIA